MAEEHCNTLDGVLFEPRNEEVNSIVYNFSNEVFENGYGLELTIVKKRMEIQLLILIGVQINPMIEQMKIVLNLDLHLVMLYGMIFIVNMRANQFVKKIPTYSN